MDSPAGASAGATARRLWPAAALAIVILALGFTIYWPVVRFDFINLDDELFYKDNPWLSMGLSAQSVRWAFLANLSEYSSHAEYWSPLTLLSRLADAQFFGVKPGGFHLTSELLHFLNAGLLAAACWRLTGAWARSAMVALLFLVHPLNVEPVCWLSARKDVLSATFFFATLLAYAGYVRRQTRPRYALVLLAFTACLMSKPMGVSLPFVLLLLDAWPLGRWQPWRGGSRENWRLIAEKLPLLILAALAAALAVVSQQDWRALASTAHYPLPIRAANAALAYATYLRRIFWPDDLAVYYPHPGESIRFTIAALAALLLALLTAAAWRWRRRFPYLLVGWFWFGIVLGPVIGLVQIGGQAMADRYAYPAVIGLFIALVWGLSDFLAHRQARALWPAPALERLAATLQNLAAPQGAATAPSPCFPKREAPRPRNTGIPACGRERRRGLIACFLSFLGAPLSRSTMRCSPQDSPDSSPLAPSLLALLPQATLALLALAMFTAFSKRQVSYWQNSETIFTRTLAVTQDNTLAHLNLGCALLDRGENTRARDEFSKTVEISPQSALAWNNLARAETLLGRDSEAIRAYSAALTVDPNQRQSLLFLGRLWKKHQRWAEAEPVFAHLREVAPELPQPYWELAEVYAAQARWPEAKQALEHYLQFRPADLAARERLRLAAQKAAAPRE